MGLTALRGDRVTLQLMSGIADITIIGAITVRGYKSGKVQTLTTGSITTLSDRVPYNYPGLDDQGLPVQEDSEVVSAIIGGTAGVATKRGQIYGILALTGAARPVNTIVCKGYIYSSHAVNLGQFVEMGPGGGEGYIRSIDLGDPAAGADYADQTVPTNALWKLRGFAGTLVSDATAPVRQPRAQVTDGTNVVSGGIGSYAQNASTTTIWRGVPGVQHAAFASSGAVAMNLGLPTCLMPEGYVFNLTTGNLAAGDNWGSGRLLVEEWLVV